MPEVVMIQPSLPMRVAIVGDVTLPHVRHHQYQGEPILLRQSAAMSTATQQCRDAPKIQRKVGNKVFDRNVCVAEYKVKLIKSNNNYSPSKNRTNN